MSLIQSLKETVYGLVVVMLTYSVLFGLAGKNSRMLPYIRYLLSLVILLMLLSPLLPLLSAIGDDMAIPYQTTGGAALSDAGAVYEETAVTYAKLRCEEGVSRWLQARTGIPGDAISVALTLDAGDPAAVVITEAELILTGKPYRILSDKIKVLCTELLGCPCHVTIQNETVPGGDIP